MMTFQADREQHNHAVLLQMTRSVEALLSRQAGEGLSGVAAIYSAANKLVTSEMLLHLPLSKAQMLANLQVAYPPLTPSRSQSVSVTGPHAGTCR